MPLPKPRKGESQDDFMKRCMHEAYGDNAPEDRTQEQAIAMCLQTWKDSKKSHKQDDPDAPIPDDDETRDDFMERCVDELSDKLDEDEATEACETAWDERSLQRLAARQAGVTTFKTHAADVHGMEFILSDESVDRMGDIISAAGWDLRAFKKNPIALFGHRSDFVIGTWQNVRVEGTQLRGHLKMAPEGTSDRIDEIRRLIDAGILKAVSVGFRALEIEARKDDKDRWLGDHFKKQELVETSVVSVPANANALAVAKSLRISAETQQLVFAELGNRESSNVRRRGFTGELAKPIPPKKAKAMTLSQRIVDQRARLQVLKDQLSAHLADLDDDNVTDEQMTVTNDINEKIGKGEKQLTMLLGSEKSLMGQVASDGGDQQQQHQRQEQPPERRMQESRFENQSVVQFGREKFDNSDQRRPWGLKSKRVEPHEMIIRAGVCQLFAHRFKKSLNECREIIYGNHADTKTFVDYVEKAASAPAMTTVPTWAQELAQTIYADFMALLMPKSVYPRLAAQGLALSFGRAGRIVIPTRSRTPTVAGSFVGEGAPIPVRQAGFSAQTLVPKKMAVITVWTREIDEHSIPAIEGLLREAVQEDTAVSLDSVLLDSNPATAVRPAGLLNGITPLTGTAGGGFAAVIADLKAISNALLALTQGHIRIPVWLMNPAELVALRLTPSPLGEFVFAAEVQAGNLLGFPIIDSGTVPVGTIVLVDAADFVAVGAEAPRFEISDTATLHMEDTAPLPIVDGGTPAAPVRSLWQTDSLGLRLIMPMNWTMRRPIVVAATGVTW